MPGLTGLHYAGWPRGGGTAGAGVLQAQRPARMRLPREMSTSVRRQGQPAYFGKGSDIPGNRRDQQELSVLCLRVQQASIGYLNTLMIQDVLGGGLVALSAEDERAR